MASFLETALLCFISLHYSLEIKVCASSRPFNIFISYGTVIFEYLSVCVNVGIKMAVGSSASYLRSAPSSSAPAVPYVLQVYYKALIWIPQLIHIISLPFLPTNIQRTPTTASRPPTSLTVHPVALFSILDHYLRRQDSQERVIGTLLGTRSENGDLIDVKTAFAVLHSETSEQVAVDMDYHHQMYELCQRVSPKEVIVGW